ncbi:MAG TPA: methylmalonyl-CoA epimerase, partial [Bacteroidetes bacterium]|nr:methylmalonyl-CoA epimerase [Bacteroidota bacterium]
KIDHVAVAVRNLEEQIRFYETVFGLRCGGVEEIPDQKVRVAVFPVGEVRIELLEPTSADSPVAKFLEKRGEGLHHLAFLVDDLEAALEKAAAAGVELVDKKPRLGEGGKRIAFLHPRSTSGVLTELCER